MANKELLGLEDFSCLAELGNQARLELSRAATSTQCMAEQIEPLCAAKELPERIRSVYAKLRDEVMGVMALAEQMAKKYRRTEIWKDFHPDTDWQYSSEGLLEAARRTIMWINEVEVQVSQSVNELSKRLRDLQFPAGSQDNACIDLTVWFTLKHSLERQCYQHLIEPMYFKLPPLPIDFSSDAREPKLLGGNDDWNEHQTSSHPLHDVRMGYLANAFLNHAHLPWQLIGRVDMIEVDTEVRAQQTYRMKADTQLI